MHLQICCIKDNLIFSSEDCNQVEIVVIKMWCFARIGTNCTILKMQKTPMNERCFYLSCRQKPATFLKISLLHKCFSRFFYCINGTKSLKAPYVDKYFAQNRARKQCDRFLANEPLWRSNEIHKNILSRNIYLKGWGDSNVRFSLRCYETSMKLFTDRVSIDLMFGRPNQTVEQWEKEMKKVVVLFITMWTQ